MPVKRQPDYWIIVFTVALLLIGIVMVYSSSAVIAAERYGDPYYFLKRQTLWTLTGLCAMWVLMRVDYRILSKYGYIIYVVTVAVLTLTLIPGIGHVVNGAQRWISLGVVSFQPSEFAKLGLLIFFSAILAKKYSEGRTKEFFFGYIPLLLSLGVVVMLIQLQPDLGTALIIALVSFFLFTVGGVRKTHLIGTAIFVAPLVVIAVQNHEYRMRRIMSFMDPWGDVSNTGYQIIQSFVALSRGGFLGSGIGAGQQKLFYLPEPHTDFIFSIIGEELGLIGAVIVLLLFAALTWRGFRVGVNAPDRFGSLLALGITFAISLQALINISVTLGMAPTKGLPLPFISLGGSALIMWLLSIGILLNISEHAR